MSRLYFFLLMLLCLLIGTVTVQGNDEEYSDPVMMNFIRTVIFNFRTPTLASLLNVLDHLTYFTPNVDKVAEKTWHELFSPTQPYDLELRVSSFVDLNSSGWQMIFRDELVKESIQKPGRWMLVAITGSMFNVGKSWLLKKLTGTDFGVGVLNVTQGLSFVQDKFVLYIDSMGKNRPLEGIPPEQRIVMDSVVQDFLMLTSRIFIYVTGALRASEIHDIDELYKELSRKNNKAIMYMVHNFKEFVTDDEVEKHIKDDIEAPNAMNATIKPREKGLWKTNGKNIYHLVLAREGSSAGSKWNQYTIDYLKKQIRVFGLAVDKIDIIETIKTTTNHLMHQYLYVPTTNPEVPIFYNPLERNFDDNTIESVRYRKWDSTMDDLKGLFFNKGWKNDVQFPENGKLVDPFVITTVDDPKMPSHVSLRLAEEQNINYAPLGKYNELDKSFPLKMDVIYNEIEMQYIYVIDLPGVRATDLILTCAPNNSMLNIEGVRSIPEEYWELLTEGKKELTERRFNSFSVNIHVPLVSRNKRLGCNKRNQELEDGVLYIYFMDE